MKKKTRKLKREAEKGTYLQRRMVTKVIASSIRSFVCIVLDLLQGPALQFAFLVRGETPSIKVSLGCAS